MYSYLPITVRPFLISMVNTKFMINLPCFVYTHNAQTWLLFPAYLWAPTAQQNHPESTKMSSEVR